MVTGDTRGQGHYLARRDFTARQTFQEKCELKNQIISQSLYNRKKKVYFTNEYDKTGEEKSYPDTSDEGYNLEKEIVIIRTF